MQLCQSRLCQSRRWNLAAAIAAISIATAFLLPLLLLAEGFWRADPAVVATLLRSALPEYLLTTILLAVLTILLSVLLGASTAWLEVQYQFPWRRTLSLLLPISLAVTPFMRAVVYSEYADWLSFRLLPYLQNLTPGSLGYALGHFVRRWYNFPFLVLVMTLSLYPYVYFFVRAALLQSSRSVLDAARLLQYSNIHSNDRKPRSLLFWRSRSLFWRIGLPLSKTAILGAAAIVLMDVLNEYAAISYFGYTTISSGVYRAWFHYQDLGVAKLLAFLVLIGVICLACSLQRSNLRYDQNQYAPPMRTPAKQGLWLSLYYALPIVLGFFWPLAQFVSWARHALKTAALDGIRFVAGMAAMAADTLGLLAVSAAVATLLALFVSYRHHRGRCSATLAYAVISQGYAIPGTVVAIAVLGFAYHLAQVLGWTWQLAFGQSEIPGLLVGSFFNQSIGALVFAVVLRFFYVVAKPIHTGFHCYSLRYEQAAYSLGANASRVFWRVVLPLNRPFILSGILLLIIEVLKEITLTLMLRPFGFDTLAIKAYLLARDEMLIDSSLPTLLNIAITAACVIWFQLRATRL